MGKIKVALLQMTGAGFDQPANLEKGKAFCHLAKTLGADIALFPEMWNVGYTFFDPREPSSEAMWATQAISQDDEFFLQFQRLAKELEMAIAITFLERWKGAPRNSVALIDRRGEVRLTYAKVHTCDFDTEAALQRGDDFYVCELDTAGGMVKVGAMICYDRESPESARILMLKGAELILTPNACELEPHRLNQFRTRAFENMVGVAMANYAAPQNNGRSAAFDGVTFDKNGTSLDTCLVQAGEAEGVYLAEFDIDRLRGYREREIWGNAFRRPGCYNLLSGPDVKPPFVRSEARR